MIAAMTLLLLHAGPAAAALTNGDFEHGPDSWDQVRLELFKAAAPWANLRPATRPGNGISAAPSSATATGTSS